MEVSKYCEMCKNSNCKKQQPDMADMKPACYVAVEMVEYEGDYVPKELCSIDAHGGVDDVVSCSGTCEQEECDTCVVTKVFNEYARLTNQIKIMRNCEMKRFPIMIGRGEKDYIPYDVIKPHERQALLNHGQTLDQLAERGGLSWSEAYAVLMDRDFPCGKEYISKEYYEREVRRIVEKQN